MDADTTKDPARDVTDDDFIAYLANRLGIESREARERLSAWLAAYEPPPKSGVRKVLPERGASELEEPDELTRSA